MQFYSWIKKSVRYLVIQTQRSECKYYADHYHKTWNSILLLILLLLLLLGYVYMYIKSKNIRFHYDLHLPKKVPYFFLLSAAVVFVVASGSTISFPSSSTSVIIGVTILF